MPAPLVDEVQMPPDISRGATFGPSFSTIVITTTAGSEQRVAQWTQGKHRGTISQDMRTPAQFATLKAFFVARMGRARGFRFKDWSDYTATSEPLAPTGAPTAQLIKTYTSGGVSYVRNIYKPVASPAVTLTKNGSAFAGFTLDTTTGLVTLTALNTKTITAITQANPAVVTVGAAHGFSVNDLVYFTGVGGMTQINTLVGTVSATSATTITVGIDASTFSAFTTGGSAIKYLAAADLLAWSGQFDTPVRFDTDEMSVIQEDVSVLNWSSIPIVELLG